MIEIADLRFIRAVAGACSLAAAARELDVTPPAVSQRLTQLEARLRLKLVERGAGKIQLTSEGEMMAERAEAILSGVADLSSDLAERRDALSGPLRIVASFGFGRLHVAPIIASFALLHPEILPTLLLSDDPRGMIRSEAWDVLIHVGALPDQELVQRKLVSNRRFLCASPDYTQRHGTPATPLDLENHRCGVVRQNQADVTLWSLSRGRDKHPETIKSIRVRPSFASNDGEVLRAWAIAGLGIIERSEWSVHDDLKTGRLIQVLPKWSLANADIIAIANPRIVRTNRVESFLQYLAKSGLGLRETR